MWPPPLRSSFPIRFKTGFHDWPVTCSPAPLPRPTLGGVNVDNPLELPEKGEVVTPPLRPDDITI